MKMKMKKVILFTWFGDEKPKYINWTLDNFRKMNPTWEIRYIEYSNEQIINYEDVKDEVLHKTMAQMEYSEHETYVNRVADTYRWNYLDMHRDELVIYLDLDCFPIAPLDNFLYDENGKYPPWHLPKTNFYRRNLARSVEPRSRFNDKLTKSDDAIMIWDDIWAIRNNDFVFTEVFFEVEDNMQINDDIVVESAILMSKDGVRRFRERKEKFRNMELELGSHFCSRRFTPVEHYNLQERFNGLNEQITTMDELKKKSGVQIQAKEFRDDVDIESLLKNSFMIHVKDDFDRLNLEKAIFKYHNVPFPKIFDAYTDNGEFKTAANRSHYELVKYAKENKLPYILVFEDDAYIVNGFLDKLSETIKSFPLETRMLRLGYSSDSGWSGEKECPFAKNLIGKIPCNAYCACCYVLFESGYDNVMDSLKKGEDIDTLCMPRGFLTKYPYAFQYNFGVSLYGAKSYSIPMTDEDRLNFIKANYTPIEKILEVESSREFISKEDIGKYIHEDNAKSIFGQNVS